MIGPGLLPATYDQAEMIEHETYEIEHHVHNVERWLGASGTEDSLTGYSVVSGNGAFGNETVLLTAIQTPIDQGNLYFDFHHIAPLTISSATVYLLRLIWGTGTVGEAELARQYSVTPILTTGLGSNIKGGEMPIMMPRLQVGTMVWAKCKNATNLATITFLIGLHEYER